MESLAHTKHMKRVIAFGAFDPITEGQKNFLQQAKALGDYLIVVVAHESAVRAHKHRDARHSEEDRLAAVKKLGIADEVVLGRKSANKYHILKELDFDVVAMGYNQKPSDFEVREALDELGKQRVKIIRCREYAAPAKIPMSMMFKIAITIILLAGLALIGFLFYLAWRT